jgi:hypothetical protein
MVKGGIMQMFFTYERDEKRRPMTTRCILIKDDRVTFGQAKCSDKDRPVKKVGRAKATGRALRAAERNITEFSSKNNERFFKSLSCISGAILNEAEKRWLEKHYERFDHITS